MALISKAFADIITFTRASTGTRVNVAGLIESVATDQPRFDYDPVTLAPKGLLIEEARTNLLTYSNDFSNAVWSKSNISLGAAVTGPDGLASLAKVEATASSATTLSRIVSSAGSASGNTFSIYAKKGSGATDANKFCLRNSTTATDLIIVSINYDTGALTYSVGTGPATAVNAGNGIWRIPLAATTGISAGNNLAVHVCFIGGTETAGEYAYAGFAQLEAGAFATSYIPTTSAAVTRAADIATITGTNFSSWLNPVEGTFMVEFDSAGNAFQILGEGSAVTGLLYSSARDAKTYNGATGIASPNLVAPSGIGRAAIAYNSAGRAICLNGGVVTEAAGLLQALSQLLIGGDAMFGGYLNGHIRSIRYYPVRLPNATLQSLTA